MTLCNCRCWVKAKCLHPTQEAELRDQLSPRSSAMTKLSDAQTAEELADMLLNQLTFEDAQAIVPGADRLDIVHNLTVCVW